MNYELIEKAYIRMLSIMLGGLHEFEDFTLLMYTDMSATIALHGKDCIRVFEGRMSSSIFGIPLPKLTEVNFNLIGL